MEALHKSLFRHNVIAQNDIALQLFSSSDEDIFTGNNFIENLSPLYLIGKRTTTRWELDGRGNFWSDYDGYDLDANGIGDVPHKVQNVFEYLEGNYPRLRLFLESPAAQALALAERAFPIFEGSTEIDRAPLTRALALPYPFQSTGVVKSHDYRLGAISLAMASCSLWTIWQRQRRFH